LKERYALISNERITRGVEETQRHETERKIRAVIQASAPAPIGAPDKRKREKTEKGVFTAMEISEWIQKFLARLGIKAGQDVTPEDALELIEPLAKKLAIDAVDDAIAASMLFPDERESLMKFALDHPLAFKIFLEKRGPVRTTLSASAKSAASAKARMTETEKDIARQVGVTEAQFLRYNCESDAAAGMTKIDREMAAKVGVSPKLFLRYNPPANR